MISNHLSTRRAVNQQDPSRPREIQFRLQAQVGPGSGLLAKLVAGTLAVAALAAGLFLSVFVFAGLLVVGVVAGGWIWWRTRGLRRQLKETLKTAEARLAAARAEADRRQAGAAGASAGASGAAGPAAPGAQGARRPAPDATIIDGDYIRPKDEPPSR
jgi:hypothetical protein